MAQGVSPDFKPQYCQKKKKKPGQEDPLKLLHWEIVGNTLDLIGIGNNFLNKTLMAQ
jgi:hypothetical protein